MQRFQYAFIGKPSIQFQTNNPSKEIARRYKHEQKDPQQVTNIIYLVDFFYNEVLKIQGESTILTKNTHGLNVLTVHVQLN